MKTMGSFFLTLNRLLLGGLFIFEACLKLFVIKPEGVTNIISNLGFPLPLFFAWVLILSELVFGFSVFINWRLKLTTWPLVIILVIAALSQSTGDWFAIIVHLILASNLLALGSLSGSRERKRPEINRPRVQKPKTIEKKVVEVKSKKVTPKKVKKKAPKKTKK
ncbi:hypothetical protein CXT76_02370 [Candidatus Parvarchaeota archaeon]|jgi:uncharacterized membrane protein YphA (DoxX/SURF4 family)|nr:MAG: hypothetical protein CXT76_02370 [Candidatus Parvarchaeota archaeon]